MHLLISSVAAVFGGSPVDGASALDGADYITVVGSLSSSAIYGNSGADSLLIGGNATAASPSAVATMIWSVCLCECRPDLHWIRC